MTETYPPHQHCGAAPAPLRVGLILGAGEHPRWAYESIEHVRRLSEVQLVLVITDRMLGAPLPSPQSRGDHSRPRAGGSLFRAYLALDQRVFKPRVDLLQPAPLGELIAGVPAIAVERIGPGEATDAQWPAATVAAVGEYRLDVLLYFGQTALRGEALTLARHGVWFHHFGENLATWGAPPGAWEVFERRAVTGSLLAVMAEPIGASRVIYRSYTATDSRSITRSRSAHYGKTATFAARKLRDLYQNGDQALAQVTVPEDTDHTGAARLRRHSDPPGEGEMVPIAASMAARLALGRLERTVAVPEWFVAFSFEGQAGSALPRAPWQIAGRTMHQMAPPPDRYWADPFPVRHGSQYYIFLEEYLHARKKAHIAVARVRPDGSWDTPEPVLERPYHLSYPHVFEWQGDYYMVPETRQNRTIELYRAESFPSRWVRERVLVEPIEAVDSTLAEIGGTWWLFTAVASDARSNADELHLYSAADPRGPWAPHPRNPVLSDARTARPAGAIMCVGGEHIRPSQDCSARYGHAVVLNRIERIDSGRYEEHTVERILPSWTKGLQGTHTLNEWDGLLCIDGVRNRLRLPRRVPLPRPR